MRATALGSAGRLELRPPPWAPGRYLLVKRSPNTDNARFVLAMEVDGIALMDMSSDYWTRPSLGWSLLLPDGAPLAGTGPIPEPDFEKPLGSQSQPLVLQAEFAPRLKDLLRSAGLSAISRRTRMDQKCRGKSGRFWPMMRPLFQATRTGRRAGRRSAGIGIPPVHRAHPSSVMPTTTGYHVSGREWGRRAESGQA